MGGVSMTAIIYILAVIGGAVVALGIACLVLAWLFGKGVNQ